MDGDDAKDEEYTMEVEEAELSSDEERGTLAANIAESPEREGHRRTRKNSPPLPEDDDYDDIIIEEEDDADGDKEREEPHPNGTAGSDGESSSRSSGAHNRDVSSPNDALPSNDRSRIKDLSSDENSDAESMSAASNDGEPQRAGTATHESNDGDSDYAQSDDDDASVNSDDDSDAVTKPKRNTKRPQQGNKLVIPKDMLDDTQYFRRSRRTRNAPDRLAGSPNASDSSDAAVESDSDFEANDGTLFLYRATACFIQLSDRFF